MPVPAIDLKAVWTSGVTYTDWLAKSAQAARDNMEKTGRDVVVTADEEAVLKGIKRPVHVIAIAEDWCGDVKAHTPILGRLVTYNTNLMLRCVDKETRPELMVRYLTNSAEAIPIFIFLNNNFTEVGYWGPRPYECKRLMARGKAAGKIDDARKAIGKYYETDKLRATVKELTALFELASAESV